MKSDKEVYSYTLSSKHEEEAQLGETIPEGAYNSGVGGGMSNQRY